MIWMICRDKEGSLWLMRVKSRSSGVNTLRDVFRVEPVKCTQLHYDNRSEYFIQFRELCKELLDGADEHG